MSASRTGSEEQIPAIILGGYVTALGSLRSLAEGNVPCHCVTPAEEYVLRSRHYRPPPAGLGRLDDPNDLDRYLESLPFSRAVLMPCQDHWVRAASRLGPGLRDRFLWSGPAAESVEVFLDKERLLEALERFSVPRPLTIRLHSEADLSAMDGADDVTWFLKPTDSQAFRNRFGVKAMHVTSREDAAARMREIQRAELDVVLQEYVPGGADCHYFIDGFIDRGGEVRALFVRRRTRMWPRDFGDSSFMHSVAPDEAASAGESLKRLLAGVGHRGIFSAEFKRDPRDGEFRLIEVNVRAWAYVEFTTLCGVNMPWMAYRDALGQSVQDVTEYTTGRAGGVFAKDSRSFLAMRRQGELGLWEWARSWLPARDLIFRWDDPLPGLAQVVRGRR